MTTVEALAGHGTVVAFRSRLDRDLELATRNTSGHCGGP